MKMGLFVGLVTLDFIYLAEHLPGSNQKIVAADATIAAGGPATNAAVAFAYWDNSATLIGVVGCHPMTQLIRSDLAECGVNLVDWDGNRPEPPSVSSIIVTQTTGERAVVSVNATQVQIEGNRFSPHILQDIDIVLIDGHQMAIGREIAKAARSRNIPVAIDGGSWKPGFDTVLPYTNYAICSANFQPPGCANREEVFAYLQSFDIPHIAITRGERSILFYTEGERGEIEVPQIEAIDTLGAGDIFHGAFCYFILSQSFADALESSARVASRSCQFFGTRKWRIY
ncbi:MAG TPA: sugar kinase [Oscillatoriales cyanobacterium M59_W2019_021]|nr:MAG: sugar kinase [Cyanobacteria bacterium J055]HIK33753.1 sugar kinase [Oscillatoriales cyanobacterium M4454_W2019_049]HIK52466.1 sugar kinase [Oscillatoriales cyanobacterium M59_W2019_021]